MFHQRLRAMMPGADGDIFLIQYGADIVRMHPLDLEREDAGAVLRAKQADAVDGRQRLARLAHQRDLMGVDHGDPDRLHIIDRGGKAERFGDRGSACLEAGRRRGIGRACKGNAVDH